MCKEIGILSEKPLSLKPSLAAAFLCLVALLIRVFRISSQSLWHDEGEIFLLGSLDLKELVIASPKFSFYPPLFHFIVKILISIFPHEPWIIRMPSLIACVISVYVVFALVRFYRDEKTAVLCASLLAVSPISVFYAHEG